MKFHLVILTKNDNIIENIQSLCTKHKEVYCESRKIPFDENLNTEEKKQHLVIEVKDINDTEFHLEGLKKLSHSRAGIFINFALLEDKNLQEEIQNEIIKILESTKDSETKFTIHRNVERLKHNPKTNFVFVKRRKRAKLLLFYAPSGSGKTSVENELKKILAAKNKSVKTLISETTREKRNDSETEIYRFVSVKEFDRSKKNKKYAAYISILNNPEWKYGVRKKDIQKIKSSPEADIYVFSAISYNYVSKIAKYARSQNIEVVFVYLHVPIRERVIRLLERGESENSIKDRLKFEDKFSIEEILKKEPFIYTVSNYKKSVVQTARQIAKIL